MASANSKGEEVARKADTRYDLQKGYIPFVQARPNTKYVFVQWLDFLGLMRTRCLPVKEFDRLMKANDTIQISTGNLGTLQNDHMSPVSDPVGAICVEPDITLASLRPLQSLGPVQNTSTVMARFTNEDGKPLDLCPRSALQRVVAAFELDYHVEFLVGFEIEVTFCKGGPYGSGDEAFEPLDTIHAWGTFTDEQYTKSMDIMLSITTALQDIGIEIITMHTEAGAGQYEFVLPPYPPIQAVDTLIQARQCIMQIAATHNLRATCHPTPFSGIGQAAHAHISFNRSASDPNVDMEKLEMPFMASVLEHIPSLCALTMPQAASYGRVIANSWTGGTWIGWGTQNREVPLRKSGPLRWEIRCLDGFANMYLALAAIMSVGLLGVKNGMEMKMKDCPSTPNTAYSDRHGLNTDLEIANPSNLSDQQLEELGITKKLPTSLDECIEAAEKDEELENAMGHGILRHYLGMKKAEQEMLSQMSEGQRRVWLIERY